MAQRGRKPGTPKTGGRKKGSGNKSMVTEEQAQAIRNGITPLEHMLSVMRSPMPTQMDDEPVEAFIARCKHHIQRQDAMAVAAAPYVNPRLANVVHKEDPDQFKERHEEMDLMETARRMAFIFATADSMDEDNATRQ